jgi:hypothetical protein
LTVGSDDFDVNDRLEISVRVENTGQRAGAEVVQLYVSECSRPFLAPGGN